MFKDKNKKKLFTVKTFNCINHVCQRMPKKHFVSLKSVVHQQSAPNAGRGVNRPSVVLTTVSGVKGANADFYPIVQHLQGSAAVPQVSSEVDIAVVARVLEGQKFDSEVWKS